MDLHQLQAFEQIVLQGNFSKAARRLNISQPTISLRIQALEQEVGGALFVRGGGHPQLTELGRSFLPYAQQALRAITTGVDIAQRTMQGKRGRITIGTLPSLATGFFASTLARLHSTHPHLDIVVHTGHNQQIAEMLYDGYVQMGFLTGPFFHPDMTTLLRLQEPLLVVAPPASPLATHKNPTLSDLARLGNPFFHIDWSSEARHWQFHMLAHDGPMVEVPPQTAHDLLLHGIGAALLTRSLVSEDLNLKRLVEIPVQEFPPLQRESVLVRFKREEALPAAANEFLNVLSLEARHCLSNVV